MESFAIMGVVVALGSIVYRASMRIPTIARMYSDLMPRSVPI